MKKISLLACLILFVFSGVFAQNKKLSIEDATIGSYAKMYPQYIRALQWRTAQSYIFLRNDTVYEGFAKTKDEKKFFSLRELNSILKENKIDTLKKLTWAELVDENTINFESAGLKALINIATKKVDVQINYTEEAENNDFCRENSSMAYTVKNNLFVVNKDAKVTQITNETDAGIVCGQIVSRNEFGINKGTFWSPKGTYLAFYRKDERQVTDYPLVDVMTRIAEVQNKKYPMAGMTSERVSLGVYNLATGKTIYIEQDTASEKYLTNITWEPSEQYIYIQVLNREQNHMLLNKYDATTGALVKTLFEEKSDKYVEPLHSITFLKTTPNQFVFWSDRDGFRHLYLYDTDGNLKAQLTKGEYVVTSLLGFDAKEKFMFYSSTAVNSIENQTYKYEFKTTKTTLLTTESGMHESELSPDANYLIDSYSNITTPRITNIVNTNGKIEKNLLTADNPLKDYELPKPQIVTLKAADGVTDLYGRLIPPLNRENGKKYPVIVYVYGGPHDQLVENSWMSARLWEYYMASRGYVVWVMDNRGADRRGMKIESVIHRNLGQAEMADQMKGIEYLKSLPFVDQNLIGVHGWSYGGFMTISLLTNYPDVFKVGVAGGPVIDWKFYEVMYGERYMDVPQENPDGYSKCSLLGKSKNLKGKLLIIQGDVDATVVPQNCLSFIKECVTNDIPVDFFLYPTHEHNVRGKDRLHLMKKVTAYFDDYLK